MTKRVPKEVLDSMNIPSFHEFKKLKRRQMREILAAIKAFHQASSYTPGYEFWRLKKIEADLKQWQHHMRKSRWVV